MNSDDPVELPSDGVLDLHAFSPKEVKDLVPEYIEECLRRGITEIRIIHGKGTGTLKAIVHAILEKDPRGAAPPPRARGPPPLRPPRIPRPPPPARSASRPPVSA